MKKILVSVIVLVCLLSLSAPAAGPWTTTGEVTTEAFSVSAIQWKILWDVSPAKTGTGWISIHVHDKATGDLVETASADTSGKGQTIIHRAGQFYLSISVIGAARVWTE